MTTAIRFRRAIGAGLIVFAMVVALTGCAQNATPTNAPTTTPQATAPAPVEITVSAASSLKNILTATAPAFEKANNAKLVFNFGATGVLIKQIEGGAPADVFAAASPAAVATLAAESLVSVDASETFAGNTLVILVPKGNPAGIQGPNDLAKANKLTTGDPTVAPHGQKALEWLTGIGLWDTLLPKFVFAANASQTDDYVARGEVDAGIGYNSDAVGRSDLEVAYTVPDDQIKPIKYVAVPVTGSKQAALVNAYLAYLLSADVQKAFVDAGFRAAPVK